MKRFFLAVTAMMAFSAMQAAIEVPAGSGIYYDWDGDNLFYVNWIDNSVAAGDVVIPDTVTIDGYDYTPQYFGQYANFWGNANITSLTIKAPVAEITGWMCQQCTGLAKVTIGEGCSKIGEAAFEGCTALTEVNLPASLTEIVEPLYDKGVFQGCSSLATLNIEECTSLATIGAKAFFGTALPYVTLPSSVNTIGEYAFDGCPNLSSITFMAVPSSIGTGLCSWRQEGEEYFAPELATSYWNLMALMDAIAQNNSELYPTYKVWDTVLDETWDNGQYLAKAYTELAVINRTLTGGKWSPILLPFYLDEDALKQTFGNGVKLAEFTGADASSLKFSIVTVLEANKPYIIKVGETVSQSEAQYVWLDDDFSNMALTIGGNSFIGTLNGFENIVPEGALYIENGEVKVSDGKTALMAMSGYFEAPATALTIVVDGESGTLAGDLDGNGLLEVNDVVILAELAMSGGATAEQISIGDMDGSGDIDVNDVVILAETVMGA